METEKKFDDDVLLELIRELLEPLNSFINYAYEAENKGGIINTDFLGRSKSVASRIQERLDYYNAKNNKKWKPLRENIAELKLFADVTYITLHIKSASPRYSLIGVVDTFPSDTEKVLARFSSSLYFIFSGILKNAESVGFRKHGNIDKSLYRINSFPEGRLTSDLKKSKVEKPEKMIVNLATSYLNLASESTLLRQFKNIHIEDYFELVPNVINENTLRSLECKFHNLQSMYDTYVSNTDIEDLDADLRLMRGHTSIVYHLLEAATSIVHYYERHIMILTEEEQKDSNIPISSAEILGILVDYYLYYSEQFLTAGKTLCREVIKKYAEKGSITVKVPGYRGFHVRPSTLVSKIVQHYGSEVFLIIDGEKYDASSPMNLFRVNEKINAAKRRNLARNINSLKCILNAECNLNFDKGLKEIFHELLEENKIINYATEFSLPELTSISEETLGEFANRAIANLLAQGQIDLKTDMNVSFQGDKRVLIDIEILASCGYGEDPYGNNIVLPQELSYLRRS